MRERRQPRKTPPEMIDRARILRRENAAEVEKRLRYLEDQGFRVPRFWNNDVIENMQGVLEVVAAAVADVHPSPDPTSESET